MFLLALNPYIDAILALALAFIGLQIIKALFGPLYGLPAVGGYIERAVHSINQSVTNACGAILSGPSKAVGGSLHSLARFVDRTFGSFKQQAKALFLASFLVQALYLAFHGVRALVHQLEHAAHGLTAGAKTLTRDFSRLQKRVNEFERGIETQIARVIRPEIRRLEHDVARVEDVVIPDIRGIALGVGADLSALKKWITDNVPVIGSGVFIGAIAAALSALGLGWLRCNSNPFNNNKNACGLWGDFAALMGLATAVLVATDLEKLAKEMQAVEHEATVVIADLVGVSHKLGL